jgi:hypothetical protein
MLTRLLRRFHRGAIKPVAIFAALIPVVGGGVLAYNIFFDRKGEAAIQLVPQDAWGVVTLDLTPSTEQIPTFKRILDAVKAEGLEAEADKAITKMMEDSPLMAEVRPHLDRSFAVAMLKPAAEGNQPEVAVLLATKDPGKVSGILGKHGKKAPQQGLDVYHVEKGDANLAMVGDYLVASPKAEGLLAVNAIHGKKAPSMAESADYQQARASLPKDANLMVFVAPAALEQLNKQNKSVTGFSMPTTRYMAIGLTIRDKGLELSGQTPTNVAADSAYKSLGQIAAVSPDALKKLPEGAFGVYAMSQPGKYWDPVKTEMYKSPEAKEKAEDGIKDFERETGVDVEEELVPALGGNLLVAVYPNQKDPTGVPEFLAVADDTNGADPAAVAEKIRSAAAKEGHALKPREITGGTIWATPEPIEGKTACMAQSGKGLLVASSTDLLEKALASYGSASGGLMAEPSFAAMQAMAVEGAQSLVMVDIRRVLTTLRPMIEPQLASAPGMKFDDVLELFGGEGTGAVFSGRYDGNVASFQFFLPLSYEKAVHLIAVGAKSAASAPTPPAFPTDNAGPSGGVIN